MKKAIFALLFLVYGPIALLGAVYELLVAWFQVGQMAARELSDWIVK